MSFTNFHSHLRYGILLVIYGELLPAEGSLKLNLSRLEQNSDRHDNNIRKRSDLQPLFCRTDSFKNCNNMEIKV
jgi:hypothetical protein